MDEDPYRQLIEALVEYAVFHVGVDGIIETWNSGAERIFGYTPEEIVGRHGSVLFVAEDVFRGEPDREMKFALETGRAADIRWHQRKDGSRFWANGVMLGLRRADGTIAGLAKVMRDDSEHKQSHELLQYHLNLADAIASNAAEALFLVNAEGRTTFANPSAEAMFGWSHEELIGQFLPYVDYFLPNEDQVLGFTGMSDLDAGLAKLIDAGVGVVAVTRGGDGARVTGGSDVPAFPVDVVDTTGCGDAFLAGFVVGVKLGREPCDAAVLGCAAAALVAQGLGSAYGDFDLAAADALAEPITS